MFKLEDCMAFVVNQSSKVFAEALERRLTPHNMSKSQWMTLYYIYTSKKLNQKELADKMSLKGPTVVRMLQKLELDGYLVRDNSLEDRREKFITLSKKGEKKVLELLPTVEKFKDDTTKGISQEDLQTSLDTMMKMVKNAKKIK